MVAKEIRKQNRLEQLGSNDPVCVCCGETDWRCLELHHIAGKAFDDDLAIVCRNCHRKLSDDQRDHPKKVSAKPTSFESKGRFLLGLADLLELIVKKLRVFGQDLIQAAQDGNIDHE